MDSNIKLTIFTRNGGTAAKHLVEVRVLSFNGTHCDFGRPVPSERHLIIISANKWQKIISFHRNVRSVDGIFNEE